MSPSNDGLSAEERAAVNERAAELKAAERRSKSANKAKADLDDVLAKIEAMSPADRALAERFHEIVTTAAPHLYPKTWYGFPAYARDGKIVCFFKAAEKFKSPYATIGFEEAANLEDGTMWVTSFAVLDITDADAQRLTEMVTRAAS